MRIPYTLIPVVRGVVVAAFVALCAAILGFLWTNAGGRIPLVSDTGYRVDVTLPDVDNLVFQSDVRMAGVNVGKIEEITTHGSDARVTLELDDDVAPLHDGVTVTVRNKTLIEETYLEVVDGKGDRIEAGRALPAGTGRPSVQLNDVLTSLDAEARQDLASTIQSSGLATQGRQDDVDALVRGLGDLGRDGSGALDALADQSEDLESVTKRATSVLQALDTQQGRIVQLTKDSDALTETMADHRADLKALMRRLPSFMQTTSDASDSLTELSKPLGAVAANLDRGSGDLGAALEELPATTADLRGLLPALDRVLKLSPDTLDRVPRFTDSAEPAIGTFKTNLADLNPMLAYLKPYGRDIVSYWSNHGQYAQGSDVNGNIARVKTIVGLNSLSLPLNLSPMTQYNPYPAPGTHNDPQEFSGTYPHVRQDPVPK